MQKLLYSISISLCLLSCSTKESGQTSKSYFSIADFFSAEIAKLKSQNKAVEKEVAVNDSVEKKTLSINSWEQEFKIFTENDINKKSWDGEFKTTLNGDTTIYITHNPKIPVKSLKVLKLYNKVRFVEIVTSVENYLYTSCDTLQYYTDSLYRITNRQKIKLINPKRYQITGKFIK